MPQISAYGAIASQNPKIAVIPNATHSFSVSGTYANASGTVSVVYNPDTGYLVGTVVTGTMNVLNAGAGTETGYITFGFDFAGVTTLQKIGTTGANAINGTPNTFSGTVPDNVKDVYLTLYIQTFSDGTPIGTPGSASVKIST